MRRTRKTDRLDRRLEQAARSGRRSRWLALFASGVGPNTVSQTGTTPLRAALRANRPDAVEWLCTRGAVVPANVQPWLAEFLERDNPQAVRWLLRNKAAFYASEEHNPTVKHEPDPALLEAFRKGGDCLKTLWAMGVPVDPPNPHSVSALAWAVRGAEADTLQRVLLLLGANADPNRTVFQGVTPPASQAFQARQRGSSPPESEPLIHWALRCLYREASDASLLVDVLNALIDAGADTECPNDRGETLWDVWQSLQPRSPYRDALHQRCLLAAAASADAAAEKRQPMRRRL